MLVNKLVKQWNSNEDFVLGVHRGGNTLGELKNIDYLDKGLVDKGFKIAAECDLKWLIDGENIHLYLYHGSLFPFGKFKSDLIKNGSELARLEKERKLIMLEQALTDFPNLTYMVHVKSGVKNKRLSIDDSEIFERTKELFNKYSLQNKYFLFSTSFKTLDKLEKFFKEIPRGSIHDFGLIHIPGYERTTSILRETLSLISYSNLTIAYRPVNFIIANGTNNVRRVNDAGFDYMVHNVSSVREIVNARQKGVMGAFVFMEPEKIYNWLV